MYEELVTALQKRAVELPEKFSKNAENIDLLLKAADAIKELTDRNVGKWIPVKEETGVEAFGFKEMAVDAFCCSACGKEVDVSEGDFKFCPHCGAKMSGDDDDV